MKSRFPKVWCDGCKSMQFAGECPHPRDRVEAPAPAVVFEVRSKGEGPADLHFFRKVVRMLFGAQ